MSDLVYWSGAAVTFLAWCVWIGFVEADPLMAALLFGFVVALLWPLSVPILGAIVIGMCLGAWRRRRGAREFTRALHAFDALPLEEKERRLRRAGYTEAADVAARIREQRHA